MFETPQDPPIDGMLGIDWRREARCIVDYEREIVAIPGDAADAAPEVAGLQRRGYVAHPMTWDADAKRYYVMGSIDGTPTRFDVGTVSSNIVDLGFARRAGVAVGPVVGQAGGPKGALVDQHLSKPPLTIRIGCQLTAPSQPLMWEIATYDSQAASREQATLGAVFMLANPAVVDCGSGAPYLPADAAGARRASFAPRAALR